MSAMPPPPPPTATAHTGGSLPYMQNFASAGQRFAAWFVDGIVMALIAIPFEVIAVIGFVKAFQDCNTSTTGNSTSISCTGNQLNGGWFFIAIVMAILAVLFSAFFYCRKVSAGQSWGQKMMGTRIIDADTGANISTGRAFGRLLFRTFISPILCWLGFFWMLWDGRKQTWHDKAVNTIVIKA
jgi:uncharacterized RDD family membrane protein YckC